MIETKRREHPLALLFWSQMVMAYGLPIGLEIAERWKGYASRSAWAFTAIWPVAMVGVALGVVLVDFGAIYGFVTRTTRRLPGVAVGAVYAIFAFLALALSRQGPRNARMAWADYVVHGTVTGLLVLLLALVLETFATLFVICQLVAVARRWRRIARMTPPQAAEQARN